eukprot:4501993-Pleurochrysis_carterae.AAC.2
MRGITYVEGAERSEPAPERQLLPLLRRAQRLSDHVDACNDEGVVGSGTAMRTLASPCAPSPSARGLTAPLPWDASGCCCALGCSVASSPFPLTSLLAPSDGDRRKEGAAEAETLGLGEEPLRSGSESGSGSGGDGVAAYSGETHALGTRATAFGDGRERLPPLSATPVASRRARSEACASPSEIANEKCSEICLQRRTASKSERTAERIESALNTPSSACSTSETT